MNSLTKLVLAVAATSVLAACSSGSSGSSALSSSTLIAPTSPEALQKSTGEYIKLTGSEEEVKVAAIETIDSKNLDVITIDGVEINLVSSEQNEDWWSTIETSSSSIGICCSESQNVKIGLYAENKKDGAGYMFYNGLPTEDMPAGGIAKYEGTFVYDSNNNNGDVIRGDAQYSANFSDKKLTGVLTHDQLNIEIAADIQGNKFIGNAESSMDEVSGHVSGGFYGPQAEELAGLIHGNNDNEAKWGGVFAGGKK